jgi:hypothetical protein
MHKSSQKHVSTGGSNTVLPAVSRQYRPTAEQWRKVTTETAFFAEEVTPYTRVELIDFNKSKIHLKGGRRISFDCLSESEYVFVCNGGYFEEAEPIDEDARV